ncbi:MAG: hypothetical protein N2C14_29275, partial [Planctomycetales bacterium]
IMHARQPETVASVSVKLTLGFVLAITALAFGVSVHFGFGGLSYPEIKIPMAAIGSFVMPFAIFNQMFKSMRESKKRD